METLKELMESLGPAEFFKTKGELRFAPKVASGDEFFLQMKDGLATTKRINSRSVRFNSILIRFNSTLIRH